MYDIYGLAILNKRYYTIYNLLSSACVRRNKNTVKHLQTDNNCKKGEKCVCTSTKRQMFAGYTDTYTAPCIFDAIAL